MAHVTAIRENTARKEEDQCSLAQLAVMTLMAYNVEYEAKSYLWMEAFMSSASFYSLVLLTAFVP